jgi:hypothetical protein
MVIKPIQSSSLHLKLANRLIYELLYAQVSTRGCTATTCDSILGASRVPEVGNPRFLVKVLCTSKRSKRGSGVAVVKHRPLIAWKKIDDKERLRRELVDFIEKLRSS